MVAEVGATLRSYDVGEHAVCWGFAEDELSSGGRGQVLAPWPNRIADGTYRFDGVDAKVPLDEPEHHNAIHGLVRWMPFEVLARTDSTVRLGVVVRPSPAYPFDLRLEIEYALEADGLVVRTQATNVGWRPAPFGLGFHDYVAAGAGRVDGLRLKLPARRRLLLDGRGLPTGKDEEVPASDEHLRGARPIEGRRFDDCYTSLERGADGRFEVSVLREDDEIVVWADRSFSWVMVYSGDTLAEGLRRLGLAVEPMTCPPNAFNSGLGVITLQPGASLAAEWGIRRTALA